MNAAKRTAKLRNIRFALAQQLFRQQVPAAQAANIVHNTIERLTKCSPKQFRQFARMVGA